MLRKLIFRGSLSIFSTGILMLATGCITSKTEFEIKPGTPTAEIKVQYLGEGVGGATSFFLDNKRCRNSSGISPGPIGSRHIKTMVPAGEVSIYLNTGVSIGHRTAMRCDQIFTFPVEAGGQYVLTYKIQDKETCIANLFDKSGRNITNKLRPRKLGDVMWPAADREFCLED